VDGPALRRHLAAVRIAVDGERVSVDGRDVTDAIRTPEISALTSHLTALAPVREAVTPLQRELAAPGGTVLEGRDTGTVVCPDAEVKFYLDASLETRARRRHAELARRGMARPLDEVCAELRVRDARDTERALAPLRRAPDAVVLDTSGLSVDEVVAAMRRAVEEHTARGVEEHAGRAVTERRACCTRS
jgi:cytidylate kinase